MGAILKFFGRGIKNNPHSNLNNHDSRFAPDTVLQPENLKPLDVEQLLRHLSLNPMISDIRRLVPVSDGYWEQLYYQAYINTATIMQQLPASQAHHHAGPGGLLKHTTEVIRHAMRIIKNYQLPKGVGPEERTKREHRWRYGVFIAALLHDVGKTLAMCQITLHLKNGDQKSWSPYMGQMPKTTDYYSIRFSRSKFYKLQQYLSVTLFDLIPATARDWILQDMQLMSELVAYLNGNLYECGVIGEIVRQADMESTSRNLRLGGHSVRFPGATMLPLVDRLMTALRHLFNDGVLKINQKGSTGWTKDGKTYLVCRTVANAVQQYLSENGATDIPSDVTRLYDTWQEHGFALENKKGGSVWKVAVKGEDYDHALTVLIFETDRLFKVGHRPDDFHGVIEILDQNSSGTTQQNTATEVQTQNTATEAQDQVAESVTIGSTTLPGFSADADADTDTSVLLTDTVESSVPATTNTTKSTHYDDTETEAVQQQTSETEAVDEVVAAIGEAPEPNSRGSAEHFLEWIKYRLRTNKLYVNRPNARVHRIEQGIALVSPAILQDFCKSMKYPKMTTEKETWKVVQKHLHKLNMHIKSKRQNLQKIIIKGERNQSTLNVYLFETDFFYPDIKAPEINTKVILIEV